MNISRQLNRSHSESQLSKLNIENLSIQDFDNTFSYSHIENAPLVKKTILLVEEVYQSSSLGLKSGLSLPDNLDVLGNSRNFVMSRIVNTSNSDIRLNTQSYVNKTNLDLDYTDGITPMDVDISGNDSKIKDCLEEESMDVDPDQLDVGAYYSKERLNNLDRVLKKRKLNRKSVILPEENNSSNTYITPILSKKSGLKWSYLFLILSVILALLYLLLFQDSFIFVNSDIQLENLQKDLTENVYDQKGPVGIVIRSLKFRSHWPSKTKVLGFIGSTGVGKTFVANILKKHFHAGLVHELYGFQLNYKSQWDKVLSTLKSCCLNLIVIDNLNRKDATDLFALVHSLPKNYYILVVSIFSIQDSDDRLNYNINYHDIDEIRKEFDNSGLFCELAVFNEFSIDQAKEWLKKQLASRKIKYGDIQLNKVLDNHVILYEGLKGLLSKALLEFDSKTDA